MSEIKKDKDTLEKALDKTKDKQPQMTREQEIAFHQGALTTLGNEHAELFRILKQTEMVISAHLKRLEELGVKIQRKEKKE